MTGRFNVFGTSGQMVGRIDEDEFIRDGARLIARVDGDEVYDTEQPCNLIGFIRGSDVVTPTGKFIYKLEAE